ncbi:MAG: hypothetical protein A2039_09025 [Candidatus Melainabacteria bacterium GWA2_34_9]|nr:MAG: hypothetical protein A2039_09025 [Candidatus Melainabacteria bacterium GWA2_34_9]
MSDIQNNDQTNIWPGNVHSIKPVFSANQSEKAEEIPNIPEKEVTRKSLYDMTALSGRSMVKNKKTAFKGFEDKDTGITISPERLATVSKDMKPFLRERPSVVMRASALGDFAFGSAVKEQLTDPMAKAAIIQFAAAQEFSDTEASKN